jgi:hypothetical protein
MRWQKIKSALKADSKFHKILKLLMHNATLSGFTFDNQFGLVKMYSQLAAYSKNLY